jgi:hypothetical protein
MNIDSMQPASREEVASYLAGILANRRTMYELSANVVMMDERPDFGKFHVIGASLFGLRDPVQLMVNGLAHLHTYINVGWEVGILNEFRANQQYGASKAQLLEVVMTAQLSAGMRGLECVYRAVGTMLRDFQDPPTPAEFPAGWAPDVAAFRAGLDTSTRELTEADLTALTNWYQTTIGEVPRWVPFLARYHPEFLKAQRLKWEAAFRGALPKQMMPILMLRHSTFMGHQDGIREGALLAKAWGVSREWIVNAVACTAYYHAGSSCLYVAEAAIADVLDNWN